MTSSCSHNWLLFYRGVTGVVTKKSILSELSKGLLKLSDPTEKAMLRTYRKIDLDISLLRASKYLEIEQVVVVTQKEKIGTHGG